MTTTTRLSRCGVGTAHSTRLVFCGRIVDERSESSKTSGSTRHQSFAYFHLRKLARRLVNDPARLAQWWDGNRIGELGALTPAQLFAAGQHERLEIYLRESIARQHE